MSIALLTIPGITPIDAMVACSAGRLASFDSTSLGLSPYLCPYNLPTISSGDTVVLSSGWTLMQQLKGVDVVNEILKPLRLRFRRVVGFDNHDPFELYFSDQMMSLMDAVLKNHGVYKDTDLYNFRVGAPTPNGRWTEKDELREDPISSINLKKIHLTVPCFIGVAPQMRARIRHFYYKSSLQRTVRGMSDWLFNKSVAMPTRNRAPRHTVNFYASLTHMQRVTAVRMLRRSSLHWRGGITHIPEWVTGLRGVGIFCLSSTQRADLEATLAAENLTTPPLNRLNYQVAMQDCKAVLSITGHGELCFRMAEAWANRRILVCQDVSHVHTMYPLESGRNVIYCRPDLSNLVDILDDIECNYRSYTAIAERGYEDWLEWSRRAQEVAEAGFALVYAADESFSIPSDTWVNG